MSLGMSEPDDQFRRYVLVRALNDVVGAMTARAVLVVADVPAPVVQGAETPAVYVTVGGSACPQRSGQIAVRGDTARLPVQSDSVLGVWFHHSLGTATQASHALAEARRVCQLGAVVLVVAMADEAEMASLTTAATAAGLVVRRRVAVSTVDAQTSWPRLLWPLAARFASFNAANAAADQHTRARVVTLLIAERADPNHVALPTGREILSAIFVPRRWRSP